MPVRDLFVMMIKQRRKEKEDTVKKVRRYNRKITSMTRHIKKQEELQKRLTERMNKLWAKIEQSRRDKLSLEKQRKRKQQKKNMYDYYLREIESQLASGNFKDIVPYNHRHNVINDDDDDDTVKPEVDV